MAEIPPTHYTRRLRQAGYKLTPPRLAVLQVVTQGCGHLSPAQVQAQAQDLQPGIGRATVYRTLELFTRLGIVRPISLGDGPPLFIRADQGHHHLVCARCDAVIDFTDCVAEELGQRLAVEYGFQIQSHLLEFYGLCPDCQKGAPDPL